MNFPNRLTIRNLAEQVRRGLHLITEAPQAATPSVVRLPPDLVRPGNEKRSPGIRDVSKLDTIVGHVTDVRGGFGVQKWGPDGWRTWEKRLHSGGTPGMPGERLSLLEDLKVALGDISDHEMAKALALCSRYAQTPYHYIASRKLGVVQNRPLEHRTWAANAGNVGVSIAVDCHHREVISEDLAAIGMSALYCLIDDLDIEGARALRYTVHGQWKRSRWNDTHEEAHLKVFKPEIERLDSLNGLGYDIRIDYEHAVDGGRPLTTRDDPDAHFDERGRRVRSERGELL